MSAPITSAHRPVVLGGYRPTCFRPTLRADGSPTASWRAPGSWRAIRSRSEPRRREQDCRSRRFNRFHKQASFLPLSRRCPRWPNLSTLSLCKSNDKLGHGDHKNSPSVSKRGFAKDSANLCRTDFFSSRAARGPSVHGITHQLPTASDKVLTWRESSRLTLT